MAEAGQPAAKIRVSHRRRNLTVIISLVLLGIVLATFAPVVPVTMYYRIGNGNGPLYNMNARGSLTYLMFHFREISYQVMGQSGLLFAFVMEKYLVE